MSLAVGVAVKRALEKSGIEAVQLKWPNDIYVEGKKLGGILLEMIGDPAGQCTVVVGVGLNVAMPEGWRAIDQAWTILEVSCRTPIKVKLKYRRKRTCRRPGLGNYCSAQ